ncbi:hypothetical protein [Pedobacter frigoris]|uniref:Uncharacterized protein n=1 Tax=Pedobacter frigoris TaxID=2571272 RepID=A0A4U1CBZ0_9SPHI|nr:hypothetical protein [Pedobacter frigoris]TKC04239.1 hypothetical protein FA047_16720 [Pedobacter frigoris]
MNPFYDISDQKDLPVESLQLKNLGTEKVFASIGKTTRNGWEGRSTQWSHHMTAVTPEDYDRQFVNKLMKSRPIYTMKKVLDHHFENYCSIHTQGQADFFIHMRHVALPTLRKLKSSEVCVNLFEEWLEEKMSVNKKSLTPNTVNNNTINVGSVNAPVQFQQSSDHSVQTQHNHYQKEHVKEVFDLITRDIQNLNEQIRNDFTMEMNYAVAQLEKDRDIKPQLLSLGSLMKDVGVGTFTNLLAAPIFEVIKPLLGL